MLLYLCRSLFSFFLDKKKKQKNQARPDETVRTGLKMQRQPPCPPNEGSEPCDWLGAYKFEYSGTLLWRAGRLLIS